MSNSFFCLFFHVPQDNLGGEYLYFLSLCPFSPFPQLRSRLTNRTCCIIRLPDKRCDLFLTVFSLQYMGGEDSGIETPSTLICDKWWHPRQYSRSLWTQSKLNPLRTNFQCERCQFSLKTCCLCRRDRSPRMLTHSTCKSSSWCDTTGGCEDKRSVHIHVAFGKTSLPNASASFQSHCLKLTFTDI